jgi:hypothetical protein
VNPALKSGLESSYPPTGVRVAFFRKKNFFDFCSKTSNSVRTVIERVRRGDSCLTQLPQGSVARFENLGVLALMVWKQR